MAALTTLMIILVISIVVIVFLQNYTTTSVNSASFQSCLDNCNQQYGLDDDTCSEFPKTCLNVTNYCEKSCSQTLTGGGFGARVRKGGTFYLYHYGYVSTGTIGQFNFVVSNFGMTFNNFQSAKAYMNYLKTQKGYNWGQFEVDFEPGS